MPTNTTATTTALPFLETGPYDIAHFTYGSGNDKRRADYADNIRFQTESVDASAMLESWNGWRGRMRSRAWGFSANELPLNAQVWHPTALTTEAPRPLTLIVHGNSNMFNRSELGYAWLAEHLASRGHIVASVDQNFINGGGFLYGGLFPENDARGWLMLEHLKQWQQWNEDPDHPFYGRVDMNQITLMGHSRGGEAVYLAGVFNQLSHYPDDALIAFDYGFDISGIIAIAPIDGQFRPAGQSAVLGDTNFFTIHGGHDSDAFFFHGDRQYYRAQPNYQAGQFKASLYLHHANHGQFNTEWGQRDYAGLYGHALNTEVLLSGHAQRQAAKAFFTAFVEHADMRDTALFCGSDHAASTLSLDIAVTRCQTSDRTIIADFNNGPDLTKGTLPGVSIHAEDLSLWRQGPAPFRQGNRERNAVWIGWNEEENLNSESYYELAIPAGALSGQTLHLELAQMDQDPPDYHGDHSGLRPSADFIIEFKDVRGHTIQHRASDFGGLLPPLPARHTRENKLFGIFSIERMMPNIFAHHQVTEAVIQSISIPLGEGSMKADDIRSIRFIFNQGAAVIMLDEVSIS